MKYLFRVPPGANVAVIVKKSAPGCQVQWSSKQTRQLRFFDTVDQGLLREGLCAVATADQLIIRSTRDWSSKTAELAVTAEAAYLAEKSLSRPDLRKLLGKRSLTLVWKGVLAERSFTVTPEFEIPASSNGQPALEGVVLELGDWRVLSFEASDRSPFGRILALNLSQAGYEPLQPSWLMAALVSKGLKPFPQASVTQLVPSRAVPLRKALTDCILSFLRSARYYETGIIKDLDSECLHQYRIYLRRIRSLCTVGAAAFLPEDYQRVAPLFKILLDRTTTLRDLDVLSSRDEARTGPLTRVQNQERMAEQTAVRAWLESRDYATKLAEAERFFETWYKAPPTAAATTPIGEVADATIASLVAKLRRRLKVITPETSDDQFHQARLLVKKLRYSLEVLGSFLPERRAESIVNSLKSMQNLLGAHQDAAVQMGYYTRWGLAQTESPQAIFESGMLVGALREQQHQLRLRAIQKMQAFRKAAGALASRKQPPVSGGPS